jgi:hypothetical protein
MDLQLFQQHQIKQFLQDYLYPLIAGGVVNYSNSKNHPFEVQFVCAWLANSVFQESNAKWISTPLSLTLAIMYWKRYLRELRFLDISYVLDKKHPITWMQCLNTGGSGYLSATWLYTSIALLQPDVQRRLYEKGIKSGLGVAYLILSLILFKKYRGGEEALRQNHKIASYATSSVLNLTQLE